MAELSLPKPRYGEAVKGLPTPVLAVKQAICFNCWKPTSSLNKCSACKRVSYCSASCQKASWNAGHKKTCKILVASNKRRSPTPKSSRTWENFRDEKWDEVARFRTQNPNYNDNDQRLILYEPYCRHCYRSAVSLEAGEKLKGCETCHIAAFCSSCPSTHPLSECDLFQEIGRDEAFLMEHYMNTQKSFAIICTETPTHQYVPLSTATDWYDFYTLLSDKHDMAEKVDQNLEPLSQDRMTKRFSGLMRIGTGTMTMPLTIIAGMEKAFPDLATKPSISIHIIGAAMREMSGLMVFEEMLHQLPALKDLKLTCVGFDIPKQAVEEVGPRKTLDLECCPECRSQGRTRTLDLWQGGYHEYVHSDSYTKPDLAVAFHTGFSQESEKAWLPTIAYLAQATHPTLFTSYNVTEMEEECGILTNMFSAKFLQKGEANMWKGISPILEVMEKKENSVYYMNNYWYIVAPKGT